MSTYLELCQNLRQQLGLSGSGPFSVSGQKGMMLRVVNDIKRADLFIQNLWVDWNFLQDTHTATLPVGVRTTANPSDFQKWDLESLWLDKETATAVNLKYLDYKEFRGRYYTGSVETDEPAVFTITPAGSIEFDVNTESNYDFSGDYFVTPTELSSDGDVSRIPVQYEQVIIERAKIMYSQYIHDNGLYETSLQDFAVYLKLLEQAQLPSHQGTVSQPLSMTIKME